MTIPVMVTVCSGILFSAGGYNFLFARRWMMPIVLTITGFYITHSLWSLTMLSAIGVFSLGYGMESPIKHIFGDTWGRGIWGLLGAIALSLWAFLTGCMAWYCFTAYLVAGFFLEPLFKRLNQIVGDFIIGCGLGSIVFFIHAPLPGVK